MSTRHFRSDIDDVDDATYKMLDSRFCKVAMHGSRHQPLRHHRQHEQPDAAGSAHKVRRMRERDILE